METISELLKKHTPQQIREMIRNRDSTSVTQNHQISICKVCDDTGVVKVEQDGYERWVECECAMIAREKQAAEKRIAKSGISEAFKGCSFHKFEGWNDTATGAKQISEGYVLDFELNQKQTAGNSLLLVGGVGSGKTMLGVCVLNALLDKGVRVFYAPYRDMVLELKANVTDDEDYNRVLSKYTNPTVLFLDDLYKGATANDPKYVYDIINARYLARKPLIVTSELFADKLLDIDEAVGSRILQMAKGYIFELRGSGLNYRLRGI